MLVLGEQTRVLHRWFCTGGFVNNWRRECLAVVKKLQCITLGFQKELIRWSFGHHKQTGTTSCLIFNYLSIAVVASLPLRVTCR